MTRDITRRVRLRRRDGDSVDVSDVATREQLAIMPLGDLMGVERGVDYIATATILNGRVDVLSTTIHREG